MKLNGNNIRPKNPADMAERTYEKYKKLIPERALEFTRIELQNRLDALIKVHTIDSQTYGSPCRGVASQRLFMENAIVELEKIWRREVTPK